MTMAEQRGGYRRPSKQESFSGVGKNSRRTDKQAIKSPNVQDSTDLQVNDRERIRQGQQVAPLSKTSSPSVSSAPRSLSSPQPSGGGPMALPENIFSMPSTRPGEDPMTPASEPPIEPEDDMEVVLAFLAYNPDIQDQAALQMLKDHRATKQAPEMPAVVPPVTSPGSTTEPGEPEPVELGSASLAEPGLQPTATAVEANVEEM